MPFDKKKPVHGVVFFDIDGTATENGTSGDTWSAISIQVGADPIVQKNIFKKFLDGKLNHEQMVKENMEIWEEAYATKIESQNKREKIPKLIIRKSLDNAKVRPEVYSLITKLLEKQMLPIFITGSFQEAAEYLANITGLTNIIGDEISPWYGNTSLLFDDDDFLIGYNHKGNVAQDKLEKATAIFQKLTKIYNLNENALKFAIGDGPTDHVLLKELIGIAVYADKETIGIADYEAKSLNDVMKIISSHLI